MCGEIESGRVGRKKTRKEGTTSIRLPDDLVAQARAIAGLRNVPIVEVLEDILRPRLLEQYDEAIRRASEGRPQVKRRKRAGESQEPQEPGQGGAE
jgi:hypothetical protein